MAHAAHLVVMSHDVGLFALAVVGPVAAVCLLGGLDLLWTRWTHRPGRATSAQA